MDDKFFIKMVWKQNLQYKVKELYLYQRVYSYTKNKKWQKQKK